MGFLDWLIPQRQPEAPAPEDGEVMGDFEGLDVGSSGSLIGTEETARHYQEYLNNDNLFDTVRYEPEEQKLLMVSPDQIEGIPMTAARGRDALWDDGPAVTDPESFWAMSGHSRDDYMEMVSHLPEINQRLEGHTPEEQEALLSEMAEDESLRDCVNNCYAPNNRVKVWELGDFYEFDEDGRHRVIAARLNMENARAEAEAEGLPFREEDYNLPVNVIGRLDCNQERAMEADAALEWAGYDDSPRVDDVPEWQGYDQAEESSPSQGQTRDQNMDYHY